jgi:adenosylhomocysteine nucleosidase
MVSGERLLLIAAEPREFSGLLRFCTNVKRLGWPLHWARVAALNGREVLLVANGAGSVRAAEAVEVASSDGKLNWICSMGFCGALENGMHVGDIFVAERVDAGGGKYATSKPQSAQMRYRMGVLASIDRVAQTAHEKCELRAMGASVVEMEAGGVARKAAELNLPFFCIRSVTDLAEENFHFDFNSALRSDGRFDTMRLIAATCRRPLSLLPELLRLWGRSRTASRTLGEFIASCRF